MSYIGMVKSLTLGHAILVAGVSLGLAVLVIRGGILNLLLWIVGLGALAIGGINRLSYR